MSSRKTFLGVLGATGTSFAFASSASSASSADSSPPSASPSPSKKISDTARAQALEMRRFDSHLDDAQIETIARGIDDAAASARTLSPHAAPLANGDEPVTHFYVAGSGPQA